MVELDLIEAIDAAMAALDTPLMGYQISNGYVDPLNVRVAVRAAVPVLQRKVREQRARIEDLEHELRLLRKHTAECPRCQAVQDHDADKAASNR